MRSAAASICRAIGWRAMRVPRRRVESRSTTPRRLVEACPGGKPASALVKVSVERILAHDDPQVVLAFGE
jgi:hypothetical protein